MIFFYTKKNLFKKITCEMRIGFWELKIKDLKWIISKEGVLCYLKHINYYKSLFITIKNNS